MFGLQADANFGKTIADNLSRLIYLILLVARVIKCAKAPFSSPVIDLATVRETLVYMKDDVARTPDLMRVKAALDIAIREIDRAEQAPRAKRLSPLVARFLAAPRT